MLAAQIPAKFPIPFGSSAGTQYKRIVPTASQIGIQDGAASLTDGFPPKTFIPVTSGGTPPFGQDVNGILNAITAWCQWQGAGGLSSYDAAFCTAISGYPVGALLASTTPGQVWLNLLDGNLTNPDAVGAANWIPLATAAGIQSGSYIFGPDSGTTNTLVITPSKPIAAYVKGMSIRTQALTACTGPATANVSGLGARAIVGSGGAALTSGAYQAGDMIDLDYDGSSWFLHGVSGSGLMSILPRVVSYIADTGSADALSGTCTPALSSYTTGQVFLVAKGATPNATTTPTLAAGALAAKTIVKSNGGALAAGDLRANEAFLVEYDGTSMRRLGLVLSDLGSTSGLEPRWAIAEYTSSASPITALDHQRVQVDCTSGTATVYLPNTPTANSQFEIYRYGKSSNALTITTLGGSSVLAFNDGTTDTALLIDSSSALNIVGIYGDGSVYRFNPGVIV